MMAPTVIDPFALALDLASGRLEPFTSRVERRISDMRGMYNDREAERVLAGGDDPLVYEVLQYDVPNESGQLIMCDGPTPRPRRRRILHDQGTLSRQARDRRGLSWPARAWHPGDAGGGAVRHARHGAGDGDLRPALLGAPQVNTGDEPLIFFAVYPADAGHDYGTIERDGFPRRVVRRASGKRRE